MAAPQNGQQLKEPRSRQTPHPKATRLPTLADIRKVAGGSVVDKIIATGVGQRELELDVQFVLLAHMLPKIRYQDVPGLSRKSLASFSQELRQAATRIEMIRDTPLYGTALDAFLPGDHWKQTCNTLREYATTWDIVLRSVRKNARDNPREYNLRLFSKSRLLDKIAKASGRPQFDKVAILLNAAYDAYSLRRGEESDANMKCEEASALRHLWVQYKKKSAKRRYRKWALTTIS